MADSRGAADRLRRPRSAVQDPPRRGLPPPLPPDCALFLDLDGTLLDLAATPARVRVGHDVAALLRALAATLDGAVALITGRAIADVDRLFPGLCLPVAGQHGCERRAADGTRHRLATPERGLRRLRADIGRLAGRHSGLLLEDKGSTLALHYRGAPRLAGYLHRAVRELVAAAAADGTALQLQSGKDVVEIRPDGRDKGTAILDYLTEPPFAGRTPVFVGDDRTDEHGFAAVLHARGWAVKVGPGATRARYRLADVAAVRLWLAALPSPASPDRRSMPDA
jgi:trehalose 6-phosphate phosphatase